MPNTAITISIIALVVSVASFGLSFYLARRDRSHLKSQCFVRAHERTGEYSSIFISITNTGRRAIVVRYLAGSYADCSKSGQLLGKEGIKLQEGEFYEIEFGKFDGIMVNGEKLSPLCDISLEDSTGKDCEIKNSRANIKLLKESKHPFGVQTHG